MTLQVTDAAATHLKTLLKSTERSDDQVIRLTPDTDGNLKLILDQERPGDQIVEQDGAIVVVIEQPISDKLSGAALDYKDTESGKTLALTTQ